MKTKHYSALFAFVAAFAVSAVIASLFTVNSVSDSTTTAQKITQLLEQDIANGQERIINEGNYTRESTEDYSIKTLTYVENSESLDYSNLPADFQRAWRAHMQAWRNHSNFLLEDRNYLSDSQARQVWAKNAYEINRTWFKVLRIAREHGAEIPAGAYN